MDSSQTRPHLSIRHATITVIITTQHHLVSSSDPGRDTRHSLLLVPSPLLLLLVSALLCHVPIPKSCRLFIGWCRDRPPCSLEV